MIEESNWVYNTTSAFAIVVQIISKRIYKFTVLRYPQVMV